MEIVERKTLIPSSRLSDDAECIRREIINANKNRRKMGNSGKPEEQVERLRETITEIAISTENVKIKCPAKLITYAFIDFNDNDERNKNVRSATMLRKELRGRKIQISQSMDAEE